MRQALPCWLPAPWSPFVPPHLQRCGPAGRPPNPTPDPLTLLHSAGDGNQPVLDIPQPGAAAGNVVERSGQLALGQRLRR